MTPYTLPNENRSSSHLLSILYPSARRLDPRVGPEESSFRLHMEGVVMEVMSIRYLQCHLHSIFLVENQT